MTGTTQDKKSNSGFLGSDNALIIGIVLLIVASIASSLIYFFFFRKKATVPISPVEIIPPTPITPKLVK